MGMDAEARHRQIIDGLRYIARQQARIITLLEAETATTKTVQHLSAFRSKMSSEFSKLAASNIATWTWGTLMWISGAAGLGLLHWLVRWLGFSM